MVKPLKAYVFLFKSLWFNANVYTVFPYLFDGKLFFN